MKLNRFSGHLAGNPTTFGVACVMLLLLAPTGQAEEAKIECSKNQVTPAKIKFKDVYRDVPFKPGETSVFEVTWAGLKAGYGTLAVRKPRKHRGLYHRVFRADASTGDWFKSIFVAKEKAEAMSRPWDFGVAKFYLSQKEGKIFSRPFVQEKWLEFDHVACKVSEIINVPEKDQQHETFELAYGAIDALSVIFYLRTLDMQLHRKELAPVYTSQKNWWLEALPVARESVTVPAGTFAALKLKLQTFIGKELQQKGDVHAWIAVDRPERPLVQIQGEIKLGSVWIKLHKFTPGR